MAASTSTSNAICNSYRHDVFLNHRGDDVKKTFASHLYRRLVSHGLTAFLDYEELHVGRNFETEIKEAIRTASVHVAIFSQRYTESKWCLKELVLMLNTGALIIPVFHNVQPSDLGRYAEDLHKLAKHQSEPCSTIDEWKKALQNVRGRSGLNLKEFNMDEGVLVDEVVKRVLKSVDKTRLHVAKYPTGVDEKVEDFKMRVLSQKHNGRVGITGLGGVGKTTLAKALFNIESSEYTKSHFLSDVRENAKTSLPSLQSQLLKGLFQLNDDVCNSHHGTELLRKHLSDYSDSVFIVLDDVDAVDHVDALLPVGVRNGLVLITSRDKDVLRRSEVQESSIYKLTGLNTERATELFCSHAFCRRAPLPGFEALVDKFVRACDGLPLSLKVLGSNLSAKRDESEWKEELERLERIVPDDIQKKLQISYDALQTPEKQMFLDVACFFIGNYKDTVIRICGSQGFQTLLDKCLVEEEVHRGIKIIKMHDHLRDLGRDLAKHSKPQHLIWHGKMKNIDDSSDVGVDLRGIKMLISKSEDGDDVKKLPSDQMKKLRLLEIDFDPEIDFEMVPNLKWFRWHNSCCWSLHTVIPTKNLLVLDVQGAGEDLWEEASPPLQLRELHMSAPLSRIPKLLVPLCIATKKLLVPLWIATKKLLVLYVQAKAEDLWEEASPPLQLRELHVSAPLWRIPKSIGQLKYLEWMELDAFDVDFQKEFGQLLSLKHLRLRMRRMELLPESLGHLTNLEYLDLSYCTYLKRLPNTFGNLIKLKYLELSECSALTLSRESFGNISTLEYIGLEGCQNIEILPSQIAHQRSLAELKLNLPRLKEWPNATGEPSGLEKLVLTAPSLEALDVGHLKSLEVLNAAGCGKLKSIEGLAQLTLLRELDVSEWPVLDVLDVGHLKSLEVLRADFCWKLKSIEGLAQLTLLRELGVFCCKELEGVLDVGHLKSLEVLKAPGCMKLKSIEGLAQLTLLRELDVSYCSELKGVLDVGHLKSLEVLHAHSCKKLKSIEGLAQLTLLRELDVSYCSKLEKMPGVEQLQSLGSFDRGLYG